MKHQLKWLLSLALVLTLALSFLPGNVQAEDEKLAGEISVQAEEGWMDYYKAAAKRVSDKYPDVKITLIEVGAFEHLDTLDQTDASNPDVADLFAIPADRLYGLTDGETLAAIDSEKLVKEIGGWEDFEAFNKGIGGNFKIEDEYFAFPFNIETLINFVNTKNAKEGGIDLEKPIELSEVKDAKTVLLPIFDAWYGVATTNSADIELLGKDSEEEGKFFTDLSQDWADLPKEKQELFTALYDYWKLNADAETTLFDPDAGWGYIDDTFASGKGGVILLGGPWDSAKFAGLADDGKDLMIRPIDQLTINGKPLKHWQGGWGLAINSRIEDDPAKMAIAEKMIEEIVNPEYAVDFFKASGKILENVKPETYTESEDLEQIDKDTILAVIESYKAAPARPLFSEWGQVWDTWKNAVLSWNSVKPESAEAAYKEIQASFTSMMDNIK